ncbi:MAG: hypothetical protein AB7F35_23400 [Acetobacteraceae bacterium]
MHPIRPPARTIPVGLGRTVAAAGLLVLGSGLAMAADRFERTDIHLERNVQDGDAELKIDVIAGSAGLAALQVKAPDGRTVLDLRSPDSRLGMRRYTLESPEPRNDGSLQADFPEGTYQFTGTTKNGGSLTGQAVLSHAFPAPVSVLAPGDGGRNLPLDGLQIRWNLPIDAASLIVLVEQEETGRQVSATLPGSATSFTVPAGFLTPGTEYKLAVGSVARSGNQTVTESSFTTAPRK